MWLVNFFENYGQMISTIALLATLGAIIWYACETRGLKKESVKQTELSQRPFVMIFEADNHRLKYRNSGQGIALNVRIKPFENGDHTFIFEKENLLGLNEISRHDINPVAINNKTKKPYSPDTKFPFTPYELREAYLTFIRVIEIYYENIEGKCYQTRVQISREGIKFLDTKKFNS